MAVAMMYPDPGKRGPKTSDAISSVAEEIPSGRLSMARTVFRALPTIAEEVMAGNFRKCQTRLPRLFACSASHDARA